MFATGCDYGSECDRPAGECASVGVRGVRIGGTPRMIPPHSRACVWGAWYPSTCVCVLGTG